MVDAAGDAAGSVAMNVTKERASGDEVEGGRGDIVAMALSSRGDNGGTLLQGLVGVSIDE